MKYFKLALDFYLKTSIHIGFAVLSFVQITNFYLQIKPRISLNYSILLGTIFAYNCLKYFNFFCRKTFIVKENLDIILVSFIAFIGVVFSFFMLNGNSQIAFFQIALLVLAYPFLRKFGLFKMFLVSFCVTIVTVYIPSLNIKILPINYYILLIQRFLIIVSLLIPFEIYDSKIDKNHIKTIPLLFGITATKIFGIFLVTVFLFLDLFNFQSQKFIIDTIIGLITILFITFSNTNRSKHYTSFWVESVPIFWFLAAIAIF
jgi:hypothetical protein